MSITDQKIQAMYSRYNFSGVGRKRSALEKAHEYAEALAAKQQAEAVQNIIAMP